MDLALDGESFDILDDVDMDVVDVSPLDDSQIMLDLNEDTNPELENKRTTPNNDNDDEDEEDDEDYDENGYAERSAVTSQADGEDLAQSRPSKRERTNAKAVECLDLDGNLIEVFRSGLAASTKLNIPQGDISLCCRGLKRSVSGFKFRFRGDTEDRSEFKLRRGYGYVLEPVIDNKDGSQPLTNSSTLGSTATRNTRASRGEYSIANAPQTTERTNSSIEAFREIAGIKTRTWTHDTVDLGPFLIKKWMPNRPLPTIALQEMKSKLSDQKKSKRVTRKSTTPGTYIRTRGTVNYLTSVLGENYEE